MEIHVDLPWLKTMETDIGSTRTRLDADSGDAVSLPSASAVDSGTTDFMNEWDERRGELSKSLDAVQQIVTAIHDSFNQVDQELGTCTAE